MKAVIYRDRFRANQIAVITSDFKMDETNFGIKFIITSLVGKKNNVLTFSSPLMCAMQCNTFLIW